MNYIQVPQNGAFMVFTFYRSISGFEANELTTNIVFKGEELPFQTQAASRFFKEKYSRSAMPSSLKPARPSKSRLSVFQKMANWTISGIISDCMTGSKTKGAQVRGSKKECAQGNVSSSKGHGRNPCGKQIISELC